MFCRRAWHRLGPLARRAADPAMRNVAPVRHMAYGIPGSNNMAYFVLCGGGLTAAMVYAYKTVNGDSERYDDRLADMDSTKQDLLPDLLTAVTVLASSATVEIAAASVGEKSIVEAVRQMEENRLALHVLEPLMEVLATRKEEVDAEADGEASPDVGMPVNATANSGDAETPSAEEVSPGEAPAHSVGEREAMAPTVEEAAVAESEVPLENPATEEAAPAEKGSEPEEMANAEEAAAEEAPVNVECTQVEEGTLAEGSAVSEAEAPKEVEADETGSVPDEAAPITETGHLAAAAAAADSDGSDVEIVPAIEPQSTSEAPVNDAEHCSSCHASDNAEEGVAPPAELKAEVQTEVQDAIDGSMVSPVEGPLAERMTVVTAES